MPNPVSTGDIEDRWRPLTDQETLNAEAFIDDAWWLLLSRRPSLEDQLADETVSEGNVVRVICAMVLRVLKNPNGLLQESIDDYTYRRDTLVSGGLLYVTSDELADVTPGRARSRSVRLVAHGDD